MSTKSDGTTKKRKGVTLTRWVHVINGSIGGTLYLHKYMAQGDAHYHGVSHEVVRVTVHLPATGIIKKARK